MGNINAYDVKVVVSGWPNRTYNRHVMATGPTFALTLSMRAILDDLRLETDDIDSRSLERMVTEVTITIGEE